MTATDDHPNDGESSEQESMDATAEYSEPIVIDWGSPNPEEIKQLLNENPEQLARLVQRHPPLAAFLNLGLEAIKSAGSEERAANEHVSDSYYKLTNKIVDGLLERLSQGGVSEGEAARIYHLLEDLQVQSSDKTTEFLRANDKTGSKTMLVVGLVLTTGLIVTAALYSGQRPTPPSSLRA
ncbi:hypothetical protein [Microbacterium sp.]|uniref:hypothetical protein n=1 Tax=Microbacterium sp. TaxID=51671 RepID=UPI002BF0DCEA|nr:hypothetical protein [Microbacterium sp.]HWK77753.1 hypothetical protein [Microbacterium sp.]